MTVTATDLRRLVDVPSSRTDADLEPFIQAAALIRTEDLAGSGLSTDRLDLIERYLAAHFAVVTLENGGLESSKYGQSTDSYRKIANNAQGLNTTRYGQMALQLDTTNKLQATMAAQKATFQVVRSVEPAACEGIE